MRREYLWMKMCSLSERLKKPQNFHCPGSFRTKLLQYSLGGGGRYEEDQQLDNFIKTEQGTEKMVAV